MKSKTRLPNEPSYMSAERDKSSFLDRFSTSLRSADSYDVPYYVQERLQLEQQTFRPYCPPKTAPEGIEKGERAQWLADRQYHPFGGGRDK